MLLAEAADMFYCALFVNSGQD